MVLFGSNLKKLRIKKKISQEELGCAIGLSRQAIASYEKGRREPGFEVLIRIADFFSVTTDNILGREQFSISTNAKSIVENISALLKTSTVNEFSKKIAEKTGILIPVEKLSNVINALELPDNLTLKVLAMYAGVKVEYFYYNHSDEELNSL